MPTAAGFSASIAKSFSMLSNDVDPSSKPFKISESGEHHVSYSDIHSSLAGSAPEVV